MITNFRKIKFISTITHLILEEKKVFKNNLLNYDKRQ